MVLASSLLLGLTAVAEDAHQQMTPEQQAAMEAFEKAGTPGPQHKALAATAGMYDVKVLTWSDSKAPPEEQTGTATRSMALDGRVLVEQLSSSMMGQPFTGHGMQGYDNVSGKYWGTWNDSMSTGLMVSEGTCDDQGACDFTGSWNDPVTKGKTVARMTTKRISPTQELFEMYAPGPDGQEMKMLEITYTRR
jgi:hypothetical protein